MTFKKTTLIGVLAAILAVTAALTVFITNSDEKYAMVTGVFVSSEDNLAQINMPVEGTAMTVSAVEDVPLNLSEYEYTADVVLVTNTVETQGYTEYAVTALEESALVQESGGMTDSVRRTVEELVDELGIYGLSAEFTENDYQLYYNGEPVYFFADNKAKTGFSGRVLAQAADGTYGDTGVITERNDDGEIIGLMQLSMGESRVYSNLWW